MAQLDNYISSLDFDPSDDETFSDDKMLIESSRDNKRLKSEPEIKSEIKTEPRSSFYGSY